MNTLPEAAVATPEVELSQLDLRYESCRLKHAAREERLLGSIAERGIEEPLEGVDVGETRILLNGFKRHRCARKLGIAVVPYASLGRDEAAGIIGLLRIAHDKGLSILEQAAFIDELKHARNLSLAQIAAELSRSKAWVCVRLGLIGEMSPAVRQKLFAGFFPVYSYMYTLRPFMRLNGGAKEVERFVSALSGQRLSGREIEFLAQGYFRGPESFRQEIDQGNVALALERMKQVPPRCAGCSELEGAMLNDLELVQRYMLRVVDKSEDQRLASGPFHAQSYLLAAGIISREPAFLAAVRRLHDRGGQT
ncbi:MAG: hypothetical protein Q7R45_14730 [Sulfuricaulis sp.]|nr:hypothetical protein [Sulfuricaulis sp.]